MQGNGERQASASIVWTPDSRLPLELELALFQMMTRSWISIPFPSFSISAYLPAFSF